MTEITNQAERQVKYLAQSFEMLGRPTIYSLFAKAALPMDPGELTEEELSYVRSLVDHRRIRAGACYKNAQLLILHDFARDERLAYFEGYIATGAPLAVHHAWVTINGKIYDPTIERADAKLRKEGIEPPRDRGYFGVQVANESVIRFVNKHGAHMALTTDPEFASKFFKIERKEEAHGDPEAGAGEAEGSQRGAGQAEEAPRLEATERQDRGDGED